MGQRFQRFRAASLDEAYRQMRQTLGEDALVVRTTQVREGGIMGLFSRKLVEVTAATTDVKPEPRKLSAIEKKYVSSGVGSDQNVKSTVAYFQRLVSDAQRRIGAARPEDARLEGAAMPQEHGNAAVAPVVPFGKSKAERAPLGALRHEVSEIREMLEVLIAETPGAGVPAEFAAQYRKLLGGGMSRRAAAALLVAAVRDSDLDVLKDERVLTQRLMMEIQRRIPVTGGIGLAPGACRKVALVGATGVGKTTSVAKLAARFAVRERARVALVTADTYRVAAPEQLRVYANIIGLPLQVVLTPKEMDRAMHALSECDVILIDTAGRSQNDADRLGELRAFMEAANPHEVHLVLSGTAGEKVLLREAEAFGAVGFDKIVLTKLDEAVSFGMLVNVIRQVGATLSFITTGQEVPEHLEVGRPDRLAELVLGGALHA